MAILNFIEDLEVSNTYDFWKIKTNSIPEKPGVYILFSGGKHHFNYPFGKSPIYYIGQSKNLQLRLMLHFKYASEAKSPNRKLNLYWPRYEFAAAFGGRYCFLRTMQGQKPKSFEDKILARFAKKYRSFPIANGSGSWNRIDEIIHEV